MIDRTLTVAFVVAVVANLGAYTSAVHIAQRHSTLLSETVHLAQEVAVTRMGVRVCEFTTAFSELTPFR